MNRRQIGLLPRHKRKKNTTEVLNIIKNNKTATLNLTKFSDERGKMFESSYDRLNSRIFDFVNRHRKLDIVYEKSERTPIGYSESDNYVIVEFEKPKKSRIKEYRTKKIFSEKYNTNIILKIAILNNGKTKLTSIWYPKDSERGQQILKSMKFGITENIDYVEEVKSLLSRARAAVSKVVIGMKKIPEYISSLIPKRKSDAGASWKNNKESKA